MENNNFDLKGLAEELQISVPEIKEALDIPFSEEDFKFATLEEANAVFFKYPPGSKASKFIRLLWEKLAFQKINEAVTLRELRLIIDVSPNGEARQLGIQKAADLYASQKNQ